MMTANVYATDESIASFPLDQQQQYICVQMWRWCERAIYISYSGTTHYAVSDTES